MFDKFIAAVLAIAGVWFGWMAVVYVVGNFSGYLDWWPLSVACMAILVAFCFTFAIRVFMGCRINVFALTVASVVALFALIAGAFMLFNSSATAVEFLMAILLFIFFLPYASGVAATLAILGFVALFWPAKKSIS